MTRYAVPITKLNQVWLSGCMIVKLGGFVIELLVKLLSHNMVALRNWNDGVLWVYFLVAIKLCSAMIILQSLCNSAAK